MTDRWKKIEKLYYSALELDESRRKAFLDQACAGDQELRREVESLVAYRGQAESFLSSPAVEAAARGIGADPASLPTGGDISHYQIVSRLGEGGMGVVYKARDKTLGR